MSKITSKYQVSIPKALAERLDMSPGDEIEWRIAGEELRIARAKAGELSTPRRVELFDQATKRQSARDRARKPSRKAASRGWTRAELYDRGRSR